MDSYSYPIKLENIEFQGPYSLEISFKSLPGIYIIHAENIFLEIASTDNLGKEIGGHWKLPYWIDDTPGILVSLSFYYCSDVNERQRIVELLVKKYEPAFEPQFLPIYTLC